ncbi:phosphate acyltransferase [Cellvibrio mixtus]|uniref:Phosphate acyltransferase n=1 Tax=Cellvibrio mixtus TaxID=39650 RepID=A0A266Q5N6_9GAMM|nr:phosphate acyltransferase PlsX [Cellvibrio mixtus]OZY84926.1 phosphate acyltransferase [Cellvibrio mixtus]
MSARIRIAVDAMSGDLGPRVAISAAQIFVGRYPDVDLLLVGDESKLLPLLLKDNFRHTRVSVHHAADVIAMGDDPLLAMRHKKNSSMWVALDQLRSGAVDACVSAGNTGALLAIARFLVKTFPGVDRPAICKSMPVDVGFTYMLDLGANINCTAEQLYQFAKMGNVLAKSTGLLSPRVALLNIGAEEQKGTEVLQVARQFIAEDSGINCTGFVEANAIFSGAADVIVCDGFHGNIALKASEGVARFIQKKIIKTARKNTLNKILSVLAYPLLRQLRQELDPSSYNGASLLGLQKTVIKSHGNANVNAFLHALIVAREQVVQKVPALIQKEFQSY